MVLAEIDYPRVQKDGLSLTKTHTALVAADVQHANNKNQSLIPIATSFDNTNSL